jgi:high-affinity Fe2+/Pb2+ permease
MDNDNDLLNEEKAVTNGLHQKIMKYFEDKGIKIPGQVESAINQVFQENNFPSDEEGVLNIYGKSDLESFETDTMLLTQLNVQVKGGNSAGDILSKYTYYGTLDTKDAFQEDIGLYDGEELIDQVRLQKASKTNHLENPNDWAVFLIEEKVFEMGSYEVTPRIYIYAPVDFGPDAE